MPVDVASARPPLLEVRNLEKHFPIRRGMLRKVVGQVRAVDDVSFAIAEGETLGLVGESGCGKTTTARCILRAIDPTGGQILFRTKAGGVIDVAALPEREVRPLRREMQMIFQDPYGSLNPRMNLLDIVGEPLLVIERMTDRERRAERVAALLRLVGLRPEYMRRFPHAFSGGQRQRIVIARALALNPRLVVADEAVSALDVSVQAQVLNLMLKLQRELHLTYLFVAHDLGVVRHICDRVVVMYVGKIVEMAPTDQLYLAPRHPYTAALMAAVPMADPRVRSGMTPLQGEVPSPANPPSGCYFHPRCPHAVAICAKETPVLEEMAPGHFVSCHRARELGLAGIGESHGAAIATARRGLPAVSNAGAAHYDPKRQAERGEAGMAEDVRVLVVGVGNMGASHAKAYHKLPGFEIAGLMSRSIERRTDLPAELAGYPRFSDFDEALAATRPDAVSVNTWPNTHADYAIRAMDAGCHVFMEKPIATNAEDAARVVAKAKEKNRKLILGYILRHHPSWAKLVEVGRTLGKPLVMRMNLNQQSSGPAWTWHKNLMESLTPIVDCGVHYVDIMCQLTGARPVRVHGIGAKLTDETRVQNYGHLHVVFDDGSVGWYEAGWGPMMSEVAYFVKDVVGPKGCVSIVVPQEGQTEASAEAVSASADIDQHTKTNALKIHYSDIDKENNFTRPDQWINMADEPDHQELCDREQAFFLKAIREDLDLTDWMDDAVNSLRIVLAADESIRTGRAIEL